jgi:hypothetical protein
MQADAILRTRRGRYLIPRDVPRRAEMLAGTAVALLAVHILVAQLTGVIAVACYLTGRVTRWRLSWLAVPAAIGALWALAVGPSAAAAGLTAGPAHVLSTLGPNFGLTAAGSARAGPLRLQAAFSGAGSWLPRQLPLALITGPAEAAVAGWLDWLHTDSWAAAPARPGLFAVVRRALNIRALRTGAALARDAVVLGVNPATGARVSVPWREVAGGALVTGSASGEVAATAFRFVLTALGRRKPVIAVDLADEPSQLPVLREACARSGIPLHIHGEHVLDVGAVVRDRAAAYLRTPAACGELLEMLRRLREIGVDGDGLIWVRGCERLPEPVLAALHADGAGAGLPLLATTTLAGASAKLAGWFTTLVLHRPDEADAAAKLAWHTGQWLVPGGDPRPAVDPAELLTLRPGSFVLAVTGRFPVRAVGALR